MNDLAKNVILWVVIAVILAAVFSNFSGHNGSSQPIAYSTFLEQVKSGGVSEVTFQEGNMISGKRKNG